MEGQTPLLMKLTPFAAQKVWGGEYLKQKKSIKSSVCIGETLEVSTLDNCNSSFQGTDLSQLVGNLSYLVKFIETTDNLSIQVHPDDDYAKLVENSLGKSECWLILEANDSAGIYLGFKPGVTRKFFEKSIANKEEINKLLNFYPVKRGDFFFVPAGAIHAIGANVILAEVQQSCGVTYRVWDWNRKGLDDKPRELHLEKALDVIEFDQDKNAKPYFQYKENILDKGDESLVSHKDFSFSVHRNKNTINISKKGPSGILNFSKDPIKLILNKSVVELQYLESALVMPCDEKLEIEGSNTLIGMVC